MSHFIPLKQHGSCSFLHEYTLLERNSAFRKGRNFFPIYCQSSYVVESGNYLLNKSQLSPYPICTPKTHTLQLCALSTHNYHPIQTVHPKHTSYSHVLYFQQLSPYPICTPKYTYYSYMLYPFTAITLSNLYTQNIHLTAMCSIPTAITLSNLYTQNSTPYSICTPKTHILQLCVHLIQSVHPKIHTLHSVHSKHTSYSYVFALSNLYTQNSTPYPICTPKTPHPIQSVHSKHTSNSYVYYPNCYVLHCSLHRSGTLGIFT